MYQRDGKSWSPRRHHHDRPALKKRLTATASNWRTRYYEWVTAIERLESRGWERATSPTLQDYYRQRDFCLNQFKAAYKRAEAIPTAPPAFWLPQVVAS